MKFKLLTILSALTFSFSADAQTAQEIPQMPLHLSTMGSFMFGGSVGKNPDGSTFHGDHGYAQYYIPEKSKNYPVILWHGIGQSGKSYETTTDGREGYQALLPRLGWSTYIIDQPRRGRAGRTQAVADNTADIPTLSSEAGVWNAFRMGRWVAPQAAGVAPNLQEKLDGYSLDQFMRQQTPDTGDRPDTPEFRKFMAQTMAKLLDRTGPAILVTHSNSGQFGWYSAMEAPDKVKAIIAYEPGQHVFPLEDAPEKTPSSLPLVDERLAHQLVPMEEFKKLTRMPIVIIFGDNISKERSSIFNEEVWRVALENSRKLVDKINQLGGNAKLIVLPELGIKGNSHAAFADLNNLEILELTNNWLKENKLDVSDTPHVGPKKIETPVTVPLK